MAKKILLHIKKRRVRTFALLIITVHLVVVVSAWLGSSRSYITGGNFSLQLIAFGRLLGLLAVTLALQQFILIGRIPILEQTFGHDRLSRIHHLIGYFVFGTILLHPLFIILGNATLSNVSVVTQYLRFLTGYEDILTASLAVLCAVVVVTSSIWIVRRRLKYEWWYLVHLCTYAIIIFAFGHQRELGSTVNSTQMFNLYWLAIYAVVLGLFGFYRFLKPLLSFIKHDFKVTNVVQESENVVSIYMQGYNMEKFKWKPGQFAYFTFLSAAIPLGQHPFSFSSLYDDQKRIRITVKAVGDYTKQLQKIPVGTHVIIQGPYGILGRQIENEFSVLLIAGGIGITPIRALFERFARSGRDVDLVYAAKTSEDLVLKKEIDELARTFTNAKVHYLTDSGSDTDADIAKGHITQEYLLNTVSNIANRQAFICGPPAMADAIEFTLKSIGMPQKKIYVERFSLHRK